MPPAALAVLVALEAPGAPATGVDLGFNDEDRPAQPIGDRRGFLRRIGDTTIRNSDAKLGQKLLGLILVNVHSSSFSLIAEAERSSPAMEPW